ncbi:TetR/AcrR family transcriptional regulator [Georgenia wangjunii]|uniref:TetR/AcrR family transcriptional regulator n=1 Tax=Georgenia wangjunii TaxID=3117730 RepID=UPI002F268859
MARRGETRAALQSAALDLFEHQGYEATTVEQIASAAGVTAMTFFRHFSTKSGAVMDDPYDPLVGQAVAAQPSDLSPLDRACRGLLAALSELPADERGDTRRRVRVIAASPALRGKMWENNERTQTVMAEALVATGATRHEAQVAAGACLGAVVASLLEWGRTGERDLGDLLVSALAQLSPGAAPGAGEAVPPS